MPFIIIPFTVYIRSQPVRYYTFPRPSDLPIYFKQLSLLSARRKLPAPSQYSSFIIQGEKRTTSHVKRWGSRICAFISPCSSLKIEKEIFPAGSDSRFLRAMGIPCLGFSPLNYTPILLHDHNEHVNERVFLDGIEIFVDMISALANA